MGKLGHGLARLGLGDDRDWAPVQGEVTGIAIEQVQVQ